MYHFNSYDDQLLVQYNIDCGNETLAYFSITSLDIQGKDCEYFDGDKRYERCYSKSPYYITLVHIIFPSI